MVKKNRFTYFVLPVILLGALAIASLTFAAPAADGVSTVRSNRHIERVNVPTAEQKVTVVGAAFHPGTDGADFWIQANGGYIYSNNTESYFAPVYVPGSKVVTKVKFWAQDSSSGGVCIFLWRGHVVDGQSDLITSGCTTGNTAGVQEILLTSISNGEIAPSNTMHAQALFTGSLGTNVKLYAVRVFYDNIP